MAKTNWATGETVNASDLNSLGTEVNGKVNTTLVGVANGVASLDTNGKVPGGQLPNSIMTYEGLHDVSTNTPTLTDVTGDAGQVYRISVAGTRNYGSGTITLDVGDYLIHSGTVWQKADTTDAVSSINGQTGSLTGFVTETGTQSLSNKTLASPAVTGTASIASGGAISLFNTSDQTTNVEKFGSFWTSNRVELTTLSSGTGSVRGIRIGMANNGASTATRYLDINPNGPFFNFVGLTGAAITGTQVAHSFTGSSGTQVSFSTIPAITQSGTAGYTALLINPTETSVGSGTKRLIDAQVGGSSRFTVDNGGNVFVNGTLDLGNASDTTLSRSAAGKLAVEGTDVLLTGGALGTPSSGTLTNCTGLTVSGISATGTRDSTTYLRGDGTWAASSGGISTGKAIAMAMVFG